MALIDLNIGLVTSEDSGKQAISVDRVLEELSSRAFRIVSHRVEQSDSEPTLVVLCSVDNQTPIYQVPFDIERLCDTLKQDAIAGRLHFAEAKAGFLLGPKAADWGGKFIEEYYIAP